MTPEQEAYLDRAKERLRAARVLAGQGLYDDAVSRAYYAMFYCAKALLLGEGLSFAKHSGTIGAFGKEFSRTGRIPEEFHRFLIEAQEDRLTADYKVTAPRAGDEDAAVHIAHAEQFIELAGRLLRPLSSAVDEEAE